MFRFFVPYVAFGVLPRRQQKNWARAKSIENASNVVQEPCALFYIVLTLVLTTIHLAAPVTGFVNTATGSILGADHNSCIFSFIQQVSNLRII